MLHNYMGSHRRLVHGRAVLAQEDAALEASVDVLDEEHILEAVSKHEASVTSSRRRSSTDSEFDEFDLEFGNNPEGVILKQIRSAEEQTDSIWVYMDKRGREMEACKRRVQRYETAVAEDSVSYDWEDEEVEGEIETEPGKGAVSETNL